MKKTARITILGGGVAGLSAGYFAGENGLPFTIYEARDRIGGDCATLNVRDFFFDSGAHRFRNEDAEVTRLIKKLLGDDLRKVDIPSQIYHQGQLIHFPPSALNLMRDLGLRSFTRAGLEIVRSRLKPWKPRKNFEDFALFTYGRTIADHFLLNYSEKLWGIPTKKLSSVIAGTRLKGLGLRRLITETLMGRRVEPGNIEGSFFYPKKGICQIAESLAENCGRENILKNSRITEILCEDGKIQSVIINGKEVIEIDEVISTLPLPLFLRLMKPAPPGEIMSLANNLHYRDVVLVALFLNREWITRAATVYFPDHDFPFTRIYEPRNRSREMSPPGRTSLVAEIPCYRSDKIWDLPDEKLIQLVIPRLVQIGWINKEEIIGSAIYRMDHAYPVLEIGFSEKVERINDYLKGFGNLMISGRSGTFRYVGMHEVIALGKQMIDEYLPRM